MADVRSRQVYIGDDDDKDGGMARNDKIAFRLYENEPEAWLRLGKEIVETIEQGEGFSGSK
jgi:hypothetical protein